MQQQEISVKELRETFPEVREGLARGQEFTLTYRKRHIATINPKRIKARKKTKEEQIKEHLRKINKFAGTLDLGKGKIKLSAEDMDKITDEQYGEVMLS